MPFLLHERAVFTLLCLSDGDVRALVTELERIVADPNGATEAFEFRQGERLRLRSSRYFRIFFSLNAKGEVRVEEILRAQ